MHASREVNFSLFLGNHHNMAWVKLFCLSENSHYFIEIWIACGVEDFPRSNGITWHQHEKQNCQVIFKRDDQFRIYVQNSGWTWLFGRRSLSVCNMVIYK